MGKSFAVETLTMKYDIGKANRLGNRDSNQDRFAVIERPQSILLVLADGMGGHEGGLLAANTFVVKFTEAFRSTPTPLADPAQFLHETFMLAHHAVVDAGARHDPPINPRTTGVACVIQNGHVWWAHVGDSRFYLLRGGNVLHRTRDHSHVEDLLQQGKITERRMKTHPQRNQVTRCIGGNASKTPESTLGVPVALEVRDVVLLCSDGLWGSLSDDVIAVALAETKSMAPLVEQLAGQAELASYPKCDNVSVAALRWLGAASKLAAKGTASPQLDAQEKPEVDAAIDEINQALRRAEEGLKP